MSTSTSPAAAPGAPRSGVRMRTYYWIVAVIAKRNENP